MVQGFNDYFKVILRERVSDIGNSIAEDNKEYRELSRRIIELENKLLGLLNEQSRVDFDEYVEVHQRRCALMQDCMYCMGFADSMELLRNIVGLEMCNKGKEVVNCAVKDTHSCLKYCLRRGAGSSYL